jgi:hypothetical protein
MSKRKTSEKEPPSGPLEPRNKTFILTPKGKDKKRKVKKEEKKREKIPPLFLLFFLLLPSLSLFLCHFYFACGSKMERPTQ